ncbi:MAG: branched-chain amino acid ABC transporter permease [Acidiferrobacterales bacterium]
MYALVALGFVLIYKASGVFNFAQGAMVLLAALSFVLLLELGGSDFWVWTGWFSLGLAALAAGFFVLTRYTDVFKAPVIAGRIEIIIALLIVIGLMVFGDGGQNMWRAVFITFLVFLVLGSGEQQRHWASGVLLGLAVICLTAGEFNFWRSLIVTLVIMIVLAMAVERVVLRPLVNQPQIILFMATIGLNFIIEGVAQGVWDADVHALDIGIEDVPIEIAGVFISQFDVFAALTAAALVAGLAWFFNKTRVGRALRAVADDHQAAMAVGIPLKNIWAVVWAAAGIVALVAGLLWGARVGVQFSLSLIVFKALPVLILGGFTSIPGAIVGGLIVGATEKLFEVFVGIPYFGGGTESWSPYMLAMLFLLVRPQGLFGEKIIERV